MYPVKGLGCCDLMENVLVGESVSEWWTTSRVKVVKTSSHQSGDRSARSVGSASPEASLGSADSVVDEASEAVGSTEVLLTTLSGMSSLHALLILGLKMSLLLCIWETEVHPTELAKPQSWVAVAKTMSKK